MTVDLKRLNLNLLVAFDMVYSTRNISRAAEQLSLSQPAVSNALARLRELIGDPLFVRGRRGVEPTQRAHEIAQTVRDALAMIEERLAPDHFDLSTYRRHFRIIMPDAFEPIMMPPVLRAIMEHAPQVTIEGLSAFRTDYEKDIRDGTIDLAVHVAPPAASDIEILPLGGTDVVLLARRGHPGISGPLDVATVRALATMVLVPEVRNTLSPAMAMRAKGIKRREVYTANKIWALPALVERTDLVAILPRWFHREIAKNFDVVAHELPMDLPNQSCAMVWHVRSRSDPGHKWLRESLAAAFQEHLQSAAE